MISHCELSGLPRRGRGEIFYLWAAVVSSEDDNIVWRHWGKDRAGKYRKVLFLREAKGLTYLIGPPLSETAPAGQTSGIWPDFSLGAPSKDELVDDI